jgi:hypothetical protein
MDQQQRSLGVLLVDGCECGASSDSVLAHTSLSSNSAASGRAAQGADTAAFVA